MDKLIDQIIHLVVDNPVAALFLLVFMGGFIAVKAIQRERSSDEGQNRKDSAFINLAGKLADQSVEANRTLMKLADTIENIGQRIKIAQDDLASLSTRFTTIINQNAEFLGDVRTIAKSQGIRDKMIQDLPGAFMTAISPEAQRLTDSIIKIITEHIDLRFNALEAEVAATPDQIQKSIEIAKADILKEVGKFSQQGDKNG